VLRAVDFAQRNGDVTGWTAAAGHSERRGTEVPDRSGIVDRDHQLERHTISDVEPVEHKPVKSVIPRFTRFHPDRDFGSRRSTNRPAKGNWKQDVQFISFSIKSGMCVVYWSSARYSPSRTARRINASTRSATRTVRG